MSHMANLDLACPLCRHTESVRRATSANEMDPSALQRVEQLELTTWVCPKCSLPVPVRYLLFSYLKQRCWIMLATEAPPGRTPEGFRLRLVTNDLGLMERIRILDDGADELAIELVRVWCGRELTRRCLGVLQKSGLHAFDPALFLYRDLKTVPPGGNEAGIRFVQVSYNSEFPPATIFAPMSWYELARQRTAHLRVNLSATAQWVCMDGRQVASAAEEAPEGLDMKVWIDIFTPLEDRGIGAVQRRIKAQLDAQTIWAAAQRAGAPR